MKRGLLLAGAVAAFALALAAAVGAAPAGLRPGRIFVQLAGLAALLQAFRVVRARRGSLREAGTHDPERPVSPPPPGETVEDALSPFTRMRAGPRRGITRLQNALHAAAVAVLTRFEGHDEEAAEAALRDGDWSADPFAAALLGGADVPPPPLAARLRTIARSESSFRRGVARVVDEFVALAPIDADDQDVESSGEFGPESADADRPTRPQGVTGRRPAADGGAAGGVPTRWETARWKGVAAVSLVGVGAGVLTTQPAALLAGVVGLGYAAFAQSGGAPVADVAVERTVADERPSVGDDVEVTVTVRNDDDRLAPDVRVVDGVPPTLSVVAGSPRLGTALRPGESATFAYEVAARRGVHEFDPALVVTHDLAGANARESLVPADEALTCVPAPTPADVGALRAGLSRYAGRLPTDSGGAGVEFHGTREYRPGDSRNRVDWKRWARTGDLTTVEYRTERAARVVLVVDAREAAYAAPAPGAAHAVDRSVDAAVRLFAGLVDAGDRVGVAAFAPEDAWLPPATGPTHRAKARRLLATHPAFSPVAPDRPTNLWRAGRRLRGRLESGTGVVLLSPLVDDGAARTARTLAAAGHPVTVLSPDPTAARTPAQRLARVTRALRVSALREAGVRVLDWPAGRSLDAALARAEGRWSA